MENIDIGKENLKFLKSALNDFIHKFMFYVILGLVLIFLGFMIGFFSTFTFIECLLSLSFAVIFCFSYDMFTCKSFRDGLFSDEFLVYKEAYFKWVDEYKSYLLEEAVKHEKSREENTEWTSRLKSCESDTEKQVDKEEESSNS